MTTLIVDGHTVQFTIKTLDVSYTGTLAADGTAITGKATQNGQTHELDLQHVNEENTWAIPKPPKPMPADAKPKFEVATIKPGQPNQPGKNIGFRGREFRARNFNVDDLIGFAYGIHAKQIIGAPDWFNTQARQNKRRAYRFIMGSMAAIAVAAWLGAAADTGGPAYSVWHLGAAVLALAFNLDTFVVEYGVIVAHVRLLMELKDRADRLRAERYGDPLEATR